MKSRHLAALMTFSRQAGEEGNPSSCRASPFRMWRRSSPISSMSSPLPFLALFNCKLSEYLRNVALASAACPKSSTPELGIKRSATRSMRPSPPKVNRFLGGYPPRTRWAACRKGWSVNSRRKRTTSNKFDFPAPFGPATQVKGPSRTSTSTRFLNPWTCRRVSTISNSARFADEPPAPRWWEQVPRGLQEQVAGVAVQSVGRPPRRHPVVGGRLGDRRRCASRLPLPGGGPPPILSAAQSTGSPVPHPGPPGPMPRERVRDPVAVGHRGIL